MNQFLRQGELFNNNLALETSLNMNEEISIKKELIEDWQQRICLHQAKLFNYQSSPNKQGSLFSAKTKNFFDDFNPLELTALPINFWKWPQSPHNGPAIYLVTDKAPHNK